eukprot:SAG25_NODE_5401_length_662_cov_3.781528_1_plen_73_part_10
MRNCQVESLGLIDRRFSSLVVSHMDHFQIPSVTIKNGLAAKATFMRLSRGGTLRGRSLAVRARFVPRAGVAAP